VGGVIWHVGTMTIWKMDGKLTYLDTSGILAYLDADDECHSKAYLAWQQVLQAKGAFLLTDYVRLECWFLIQRRLGLEAVSDYLDLLKACCQIEQVTVNRFELLAQQVLLSRRRDLSLVDISSFDCMRRHGLTRAIAFDNHFIEQGFVTPEVEGW
jgi:predicted nucleic acid-binding protein